jgi:hypothetical protein
LIKRDLEVVLDGTDHGWKTINWPMTERTRRDTTSPILAAKGVATLSGFNFNL